ERWNDGPIIGSLRCAVRIGGPGILVVCKHHAMADENVIFDRHAFAKERVARYLAAFTYPHAFLNLDKCADPRVVTDLAAVRVDERVNLHIAAEFYVDKPDEI